MKSGGYQIIDLQNKDLTPEVGMVYEGIYEKIEGTRKAILISGLKVNGEEYPDMFCRVYSVGNTYNLIFGSNYDEEYGFGHMITINDNDVVTAVSK